MKEKIKLILGKILFSFKYQKICNGYPNYDGGRKFTKNELVKIFEEEGFDCNYSSKDKTYYRDYLINKIQIRLSLTFKNGFVECFYAINNVDNTERVVGRFNSIAAMEDEDFRKKVKHSFPIATNISDLQKILKEVLLLNNDFISEFSNEYLDE